MQYLARSADPERNVPVQTYLEHVLHVLVRARCYLRKALQYAKDRDSAAILRILELAAEYHDLGKLNKENQAVLAGKIQAGRLPVPHADAGVAFFPHRDEDLGDFYSALLIYAHHAGLPDFAEIANQGMRNSTIEQQVNCELSDLLKRHEDCVRPVITLKSPAETTHPLQSIDLRILFSCLTHADHGDAARASNEEPKGGKPPKLRAGERLEALRKYVGKLSTDSDKSERNRIRADFFEACSRRVDNDGIVICDAPVGTGKTTAVMSYLLNLAARKQLRRIFVILPFTNIITQSVKTYRKCLTLDGEDAEKVVAEIHHRADFKDRASRKLTALWDAPIVVTTAVAFFETLASATPSTLRRLQNLPGSAVFLDEAHAMLPVKLLPLAWQWIQYSASEWSCHWMFASGSLCHFWKMDEFKQSSSYMEPPNILSKRIKSTLKTFENMRIRYRYHPEPMNLTALVKWLQEMEGPIIVVLNTVHTTAATAKAAEQIFGEGNVVHLSTSLTPFDRKMTLELIDRKLEDKTNTHWCLVATSCVEAGVDLSFRTGIREFASLNSLLQLAGRVNRNSEYDEADIWSISLNANDHLITKNPSLNVPARILQEFFEQNKMICPELCTEAMQREIREQATFSKKLYDKECNYAFNTVEKEFKVIEDESRLTVIDPDLIQRIKNYEVVSWQDIQHHSVRIRSNICERLKIEESQRYPGILLWPEGAKYSPFLGYMEAVLELKEFCANGYAII